MEALAQKSEWPGGAGQIAEQIKNQSLDSATGCVRWEYRVLQVLERFYVLNPSGIAVEDCRTAVCAARLASRYNSHTGEGVYA